MQKTIKLMFFIALYFAEPSIGSAIYDQIKNNDDMVNFNADFTIKPKLNNYLKDIFKYKNEKEQLLRIVFDYMLISMHHYDLINTIKSNKIITNYDEIEKFIFQETEKSYLDVEELNLQIIKNDACYLFIFDNCKIYLDRYEFDALNHLWESCKQIDNSNLYLFFVQLDICIGSAVYFSKAGVNFFL